MAVTRSGAVQILRMRKAGDGGFVTVATPGDDSGFSGFNLAYEGNTYENKSGGLTTEFYAGSTVASADFEVAENETTLPLLLGGNGQRYDVQWLRDGTSMLSFEAVATVSRTMEDRGKRMFSVELMVDGTIS